MAVPLLQFDKITSLNLLVNYHYQKNNIHHQQQQQLNYLKDYLKIIKNLGQFPNT